jgi:DNA modification methylase
MSEPFVIHHGDCRDVLADMPDASIDAVVTDPPGTLF